MATQDRYYELSINYAKSLIQTTWKGYWGFDFATAGFWRRNIAFRLLNSRVTPLLGRLFHRNFDFPPVRDMFLSIQPDGFYEKTREYVRDLIKAMGADESKAVVLNQPFAADHPTKSFKFFDNPTAIVVDRDPRDLYVLIKRVTLEQGRFIPVDSVEKFVTYYRVMHERQEDVSMRQDVLRIQFEDLIYDYETTVERIATLCGLEAHTEKKCRFKPEISINNTQLFKRYTEFTDDVAYITEQLSGWLYPFERHELHPTWQSESF